MLMYLKMYKKDFKSCIYNWLLTVTFVTTYNGSGPTASTSGELFIIVFTLDKGK